MNRLTVFLAAFAACLALALAAPLLTYSLEARRLGAEAVVVTLPPRPEEEEPPAEAPPPRPEPTPALKTGGRLHNAYLSPYADGTVRPDAHVTRAEAAQMLYWLLDEELPQRAALADVAEDAPYYDAVSLLAAWDILICPGGLARPAEEMTRAEFIMALSRLFPDLEASCEYYDVPPYRSFYPDVAKAAALGWIEGYADGGFHPGDPVTRAEAAAAINRAVGRAPDRERLDSAVPIPLYADLPRDHWAYYDMMEALTQHTLHTAAGGAERWTGLDVPAQQYPEGPVFVGLDYYYVDGGGRVVTDGMAGGLYFGPDGRYTSGSEVIDRYTHAILAEITTPDMSREEMLRAAYNYTRDSFSYLRRHYYQIGDEGWTEEEGQVMFETGLGNCYCYASVFYYLSRQLGYDSVAISGVVGHDRSPHGWVEITFDGVEYIYDTELEMSYRAKGVYGYDFYHMPYSAIPWPYVK